MALGAQYCDEVMAEMFERFQPGTLPHYFVVRTIGNLAQANGNYNSKQIYESISNKSKLLKFGELHLVNYMGKTTM